jgi:hypothetical protein
MYSPALDSGLLILIKVRHQGLGIGANSKLSEFKIALFACVIIGCLKRG